MSPIIIIRIGRRNTLLFGVLAAILVVACFVVLRPFLAPIVWAAVLAYVSWPPFRLLRRLLRGQDGVAAFVMTLLVLAIIVVPFLWLSPWRARDFIDGRII